MDRCPELNEGCCDKAFCTAPWHQVQVNNWRTRCVDPTTWDDCAYLPKNRT